MKDARKLCDLVKLNVLLTRGWWQGNKHAVYVGDTSHGQNELLQDSYTLLKRYYCLRKETFVESKNDGDALTKLCLSKCTKYTQGKST